MKLFTIVILLVLIAASASVAEKRVFDFGPDGSLVAAGATAIAPDTGYSTERGFGWVGSPVLDSRERGLADRLWRDFIYANGTAVFRVDLQDGFYRITIRTGDNAVGDHVLSVKAEGKQVIESLQPSIGEAVEYAFTIQVADGHLDLEFSSPTRNWVLNGLDIAPAQGPGEPAITKTALQIPHSTATGPVAHNDRLHVIKKPNYSASNYPSETDFMRILERFPMYSERGWHANFMDNPALGYFGDADHAEMGLRAMGNYIFVTALLATDPAYDPKVSGISQKTLLARARACLAYMTRGHVTGDLNCADGYQWGNHWQSAWWTARMAAGARILWPKLNAEERANVERVIVHEADRHLKRVPPSGATSDTKSEENAWDSEVLAWAVGMFPNHPNAAAWRLKLTEFCMNTLSCEQDKHDSTLVDGKPVKDWMVSVNIHDDYSIENHGSYHFCYMACPLHSLAWGFEGLKGGQEAVPDAMFHHYQDVWKVIKRGYIGEGRFAYLSGKDWPRYAYGMSFVLPVTVAAQLRFDDPDARRLEHDRIALLELEQLVNADGSFYGGRFTRNILSSRPAQYETDTYANLALCYLLHRHGKMLTPTEPEKLRRNLAGNWSSPQSGWVIARSPKLFTSFSWRSLHGFQPVGLFVPNGCAHMAEWMPRQLVGNFDAVGVDLRKTQCRHEETKSRIGISTTGEIAYFDAAGAPMISQQVSYTALADEGIAVVMERTIAVALVKLKGSRAVNMALGNDIFNGSLRKIANRGKEVQLTGAKNLGTAEAATAGANAVSEALLPVSSPWMCVDNKLGFALLGGGDSFTIHDTAGRNAPWGSIQYDTITANERPERELKAGESIIDSNLLLVAGDAKIIAGLQKTCATGTLADQPSVRYVALTAPSGKKYLIVANMDGVARSVTLPGFPEFEFKFTSFGAEIREVDKGR